MRLIASLLVLFFVLWLGSRALTGSVPSAAGPAPASGVAGNAVQRAADRISGAVTEGAALRASDAAGR